MPIYDYRCEDCKTRYEVFHQVREEASEIVCPSCESRKYTKMMSLPSAPVINSGSSSGECYGGACDNAGGCGCGGGSCGMN
jgi:putative FmdB family regulatory protein